VIFPAPLLDNSRTAVFSHKKLTRTPPSSLPSRTRPSSPSIPRVPLLCVPLQPRPLFRGPSFAHKVGVQRSFFGTFPSFLSSLDDCPPFLLSIPTAAHNPSFRAQNFSPFWGYASRDSFCCKPSHPFYFERSRLSCLPPYEFSGNPPNVLRCLPIVLVRVNLFEVNPSCDSNESFLFLTVLPRYPVRPHPSSLDPEDESSHSFKKTRVRPPWLMYLASCKIPSSPPPSCRNLADNKPYLFSKYFPGSGM